MPRDPQGQAAKPTKSGMNQACRMGSARVPGWLVGCLRLGVGHARNRPARSLHPGRGGRTRLPPREPRVGPLQAWLFGLLQNPRDVVGAAVDDRNGDDAGHLVGVLVFGSLDDLRSRLRRVRRATRPSVLSWTWPASGRWCGWAGSYGQPLPCPHQGRRDGRAPSRLPGRRGCGLQAGQVSIGPHQHLGGCRPIANGPPASRRANERRAVPTVLGMVLQKHVPILLMRRSTIGGGVSQRSGAVPPASGSKHG